MKPIYFVSCFLAVHPLLFGQSSIRSSVEGQVIDAVSGAPIQGAAVDLTFAFGQPQYRLGEPPVGISGPRSQTTDAAGRFAFRDLGAGSYRIKAQRPGPVERPGERIVPPTPLVLGEGQQLTGFVIRLAPLSAITGRVLDRNGDPVMGAQVGALQWEESMRGPLLGLFSMAQTNAQGQYRLTNLAPGSYFVSATPRNSRMGSATTARGGVLPRPQEIDAITYYPNATDPAAATPVTVAAGASIEGIELRLAQVNSVSIRGKVVGPRGSAVSPHGPLVTPVTVSLWPWKTTSTSGADEIDFLVGRDGLFLIRNVAPGTYVLAAKQAASVYSTEPAATAVERIEVSDKNVDGVTLKLAGPFDVQGTVSADPAGVCKPANATVSLTPIAPLFHGGREQAGKVGQDLKFALRGVAPETYFLNYSGASGNCYVKSVRFGGREAPPTAVPLTKAGSLSMELAVASATLDVTVVDAAGKPAARPTVAALQTDSGDPRLSYARAAPADGTYSVPLSPGSYRVYAWETDQTRSLGIWAVLGRFASRAATITVPESGHVAVRVTAIPASDLADPPAPALPPPPPRAKGTLAGEVINATTDASVPAVTVTLSSLQIGLTPMVSAESDEQGRFEFRNLDPGEYTVSGTDQTLNLADDFGPGLTLVFPKANLRVTVGEGQRVTGVTLRPAPQTAISGRVLDESGYLVKGAQVRGFRYGANLGQRQLIQSGFSLTDARGLYQLSVSPGTYYVAVTRVDPLTPLSAAPANGPFPTEPQTGYAAVWYPNASDLVGARAVDAGAGAPPAGIDMTLRQTKVVRIRGKAFVSAGTLPGRPGIRLAPKDMERGGSIGNVEVASNGSFEISGVPAGSYWLTAQFVQSGPRNGAAAGTPASQRRYVAGRSLDVKDANLDGITLELTEGRTVKETTKVEGGSVPQSCAFLDLIAIGVNSGPSFSCAAGNSSYHSVYPQVYTMSVDARRLRANYYVKSVRYGGKEIAPGRVDLSGAGEFEMTLGATGAIIEGAVTDSRGKPVGGASLVVAPADGSAPRVGNADSLGNYYFANLAPGEYRLFAWESTVVDPALAPFAAAGKTVNLGNNARQTVNLTAIPTR